MAGVLFRGGARWYSAPLGLRTFWSRLAMNMTARWALRIGCAAARRRGGGLVSAYGAPTVAASR